MLKTYSGVGSVFMAPVNSAGVLLDDYLRVGDAHPMSVQVATETKKHISREVDRAGQTVATKTTVSDSVGTLVLRQWNAENLANALSGTMTKLAVTGDSVTGEVITANIGRFARLTYRKISSVVVQDVTDTTTYVEGTDYEVQANLGMIMAIDGGAISDEDVLHVDYSYASDTTYEVAIGTSPLIRVAILVDLKNEYTDEIYALELDSVVLNTTAEINFISEADSDYEQLPFTLSLETLAGTTSPGKVNGVEM